MNTPDPIDWDRRRKAEASLPRWLVTYFPQVFHQPWTAEQLGFCDVLQQQVGNDDALTWISAALDRAGGSTSILHGTSLFAGLTGRRRYIALIGAACRHISWRLDELEIELQENKLLATDYPDSRSPRRRSKGSMIVTVSADGVFHEVLYRAVCSSNGLRGETWVSHTHSGVWKPDLIVYDS